MSFDDASIHQGATQSESNATSRRLFYGLFQSRLCTVPTWRGWAMLLLVGISLICFILRNLGSLLSVHDSVPGGVLVVESWIPPKIARQVVEEYHRHSYLAIYVIGEPVEDGNPDIGLHSYADFTAAVLYVAGAPPGSIHVIVSPRTVGQDRTYHTALNLKRRLKVEGLSASKINVFCGGPHSRRCRLLYRMVFGPDSKIGTITAIDGGFDSDRWWTSSNGVRTVIDEAIAYLYDRFFLRPTGVEASAWKD